MKVLRILSIVAKFVRAFKEKWMRGFSNQLPQATVKFQVFQTYPTGQSILDTIPFNDLNLPEEWRPLGEGGAANSYLVAGHKSKICLMEEDIQDALNYLYLTATKEVEKFNKPEALSKISIRKDGILFHRSRILEGQRFVQAGGFEGLDVLTSQGINVLCPLIDRWSPLAYAIADYVHTFVAKHHGYETCFRASHDFVHVIKGLSLFKEIGDDCVICKKLNKRFIEAAMGPIHHTKFTIAPPFWAAQCDIWGPLTVFVPGREKNTRNSAALSAKVYALVFVCLVTKLVNIQIIESKDVSGICDGLTRLTCEVGAPAKLLIDQESSIMKALREGSLELIDLESFARNKVRITFSVCPVTGHNAHGLVEAKIRLAQQGFEKSGAGNLRLHATGVQSLGKLIEQDLNNTPFGLTAGRSESNTPLLKLISPQQMKMGRIHARCPSGPFLLPSGPKSLLDRVQDCYKLWFKAYQDTLLMKYLLDLQRKWFKCDRDTKIGDCVFFRKKDGELDGSWQVGVVDEVERSNDGIIRRVSIKYHNASEDIPRFTDRSVRSVVKLFNVDEGTWKTDMAQVQKLLNDCGADIQLESSGEEESIGNNITTSGNSNFGYSNLLADSCARSDATPELEGELRCECCCASHHALSLHHGKPADHKLEVTPLLNWTGEVIEEEEYPDVALDAMGPCVNMNQGDVFLSYMGLLGTSFNISTAS